MGGYYSYGNYRQYYAGNQNLQQMNQNSLAKIKELEGQNSQYREQWKDQDAKAVEANMKLSEDFTNKAAQAQKKAAEKEMARLDKLIQDNNEKIKLEEAQILSNTNAMNANAQLGAQAFDGASAGGATGGGSGLDPMAAAALAGGNQNKGNNSGKDNSGGDSKQSPDQAQQFAQMPAQTQSPVNQDQSAKSDSKEPSLSDKVANMFSEAGKSDSTTQNSQGSQALDKNLANLGDQIAKLGTANAATSQAALTTVPAKPDATEGTASASAGAATNGATGFSAAAPTAGTSQSLRAIADSPSNSIADTLSQETSPLGAGEQTLKTKAKNKRGIAQVLPKSKTNALPQSQLLLQVPIDRP